jgi:hypothetical protein
MATPAPEPVTVRTAARRLGLSRRTVQADVQAGCGGIVRMGTPGRGRGTLLNLAEYRAWRQRRAGVADIEHERARAWALVNEAALRTWRADGGVTRQNRQRAAELLVRLLARLHPALVGGELEPPEQMRSLLRVLRESGQ